jgi:polyphosphate kinase 2 (PPK2 family)
MRQAHNNGVSTVLAFEGWDAGGKGGTIRRLTNALPSRAYKVIPIAAPSSEEKSRHYLWRFWHRLPRAGNAVFFDRSWYGRVTVERIEGFATAHEWQRAYDEINDFEAQLADHGMLVLKFFMHISPEEQLQRFQKREKTPYKKYKITHEDYRNRSKWDQYAAAVNEMVAKTDTPHAPWHLVPANDKRFARIYVLKTVCAGLERMLKRR